jgi:predicted nucleic-acid-binding Zn-ribbon protein
MPRKLTQEDLDSVAHLSSRQAARTLGVGKSTINDARRMAALRAVELPKNFEPATGRLRILALDLETSPNLAYVWGLWNQNVSIKQLVDSTHVICFGARWLDDPADKLVFSSVHHNTKAEMLEAAWELLDQADAVMGWNSAGFDAKHLNREFLEAGMTPPSPWRDLDLMRDVKKAFRFPSNKLDYVAQKLGVGAKVEHAGFDLWIRCMAGEDTAWEEMRVYQEQDVHLLIDLYHKLQPWLSSQPNIGLFVDDLDVCPKCGSHNLQRRGHAYTGVSVFQRFYCSKCGAWARGSKRIGTTQLRAL